MNIFDYNSKLNIISQSISAPFSSLFDEREAYLNAFNIALDYIDEFTNTPLTLGQRINTLYKIVNSQTMQKVINYIFKNSKYKIFNSITSATFYSIIFSKMLDAYSICERDSESTRLLIDIMHHNIYLYDLTNTEFILEYPDILKKIYTDNLADALKDICSVLGGENVLSTEISRVLAKLLTYLSAALELPDVYVYSKKLDLDLSILIKDYFAASGLINDLEYMNYSSSDIKYYKALIRQKGTQNLMYKFH